MSLSTEFNAAARPYRELAGTYKRLFDEIAGLHRNDPRRPALKAALNTLRMAMAARPKPGP